MDKTFNSGSATIYYRSEGSGPPVVLLHGFAEDGAIWDSQVDYLREHCRLIIPDLPGSGRSSAASPSGTAAAPHPCDTTMEALADSVVAMIDREGIGKCVLIGHSMGGYIALAFAEKYPSRLSALGLFHSTAYADSEEKVAARRKGMDFIRKNGSESFIRQSTPNLFGEHTRKNHPELISKLIDRYSGFSPDWLVSYYEAMIGRSDRTAVLRQFAGPVLFIIGQEDTLIPLEQSLQQCHLPAVSHIHLVENTGHEGMLESPARCNEILLSFLTFVRHI